MTAYVKPDTDNDYPKHRRAEFADDEQAFFWALRMDDWQIKIANKYAYTLI
jgi:hypothetical protein